MKKACIFGISERLKKNIDYLRSSYEILCLSDNDRHKWHNQYYGYVCVSPDELNTSEIEIAIIMVSKESAINEIKEELDEIGINSVRFQEIKKECIKKWDNIQISAYDERYNKIHIDHDDRIHRYVECYMLKQACNLNCNYCFVGQSRELSHRVVTLDHSPEFIVKALSRKRLGGTSLISICCDGEPLISEDMVQLILYLLEEGHYVYLITNGTIRKSIDMICKFPEELLGRLFIRFSYHFFELKRTGLIDEFFENIQKFRNAGGSFTLFLVGSEEYVEHIDEIKSYSMKYLKALPHVDYERNETSTNGMKLVIQTDKSFEDYIDKWKVFDSTFMEFREKVDGAITGNCNAGKWVIHLDLMTGDVSRCPAGRGLGNIYENIMKDIPFLSNAERCGLDFCVCAPVFFSFGLRPELNTPTFFELWNRTDSDGEDWIKSSAKSFFESRFEEDVK